ncbi:MAG: hypothetical protein JEY97_00980 [Bacteroidales bacterium]|nr:hypothetical protein [Bacteroidales bacterium]
MRMYVIGMGFLRSCAADNKRAYYNKFSFSSTYASLENTERYIFLPTRDRKIELLKRNL